MREQSVKGLYVWPLKRVRSGDAVSFFIIIFCFVACVLVTKLFALSQRRSSV